MTTQHTPGGWHVVHRPDLNQIIIGADGNERMGLGSGGTWVAPIAQINGACDEDGQYKAEDEANARLIASAPDLLDALKTVLSELSKPPADQMPLLCEYIETVINKVEGKQ